MRLESKLGISTGVLLCAMFLSAFSAHLRIRQADHLAVNVADGRIPFIRAVRDARSEATLSIRALQSYMLFGISPQAAEPFKQERRTLITQAIASNAALKVYAQRPEFDQQRPAIERMGADIQKLDFLEREAERLNDSRTSTGTADAYLMLQNEILPLDHEFFLHVTEAANVQMAGLDQDLEHLRVINRETKETLWLATLLAALLGGLTSILLGRHIVHAIDLVATRANAIASGDLTGEALALGRESWSSDQIVTLAMAMEQMQSSLSSVIGTVVQTAGTLTGSADSMRSTSDQIHRRIDQQSQQTQQAATAMQEMSASIAEVSRHTQSAADTARSAAQTAHEGGAIVKQMLVSMHTIASAVTETSATVGLLGDDSRRISQIVTVIDEIARKTNLLALNAAIEAARAGDQGRGFAVVAGEVRRLAESTAQATGEIAGMIRGIQDRTRSAVASMATGNETVQQGVVTTNQAGEALERIIGMAERVDRMIAQIAIAASQQAAAADQSSASLDSIHQLSHENLLEMSSAAANVERLRSTAQDLERHVDSFQLGTPRNAPTPKQRRLNTPIPLHPGSYNNTGRRSAFADVQADA